MDAFELAHRSTPTSEQIERQIERQIKALAQEIHEAWVFLHDECDHGYYRGGHLNGEPYSMCRILAERIVRRRAAAGVAPVGGES